MINETISGMVSLFTIAY